MRSYKALILKNTDYKIPELPEQKPAASHRRGLLALSPALMFLALYVGASLVIGDFYAIPITIALVAASIWSIAIYRGHPLQERIRTFSESAGNHNILYMVWIFILAGTFASLAKGMGAVDATVRLTLVCFPADFVLPAIFLAACLISMSIGTSVGTVVALTPLVVELAQSAGAPVPLYAAAVLGGAFFGDNLSFISDTTIAATRTQGCRMSDKFHANLRIALPAAVITLAIYTVIGLDSTAAVQNASFAWSDVRLVLPYLLVIGMAACGVNVTVVLICGIIAALAASLPFGMTPLEAAGLMGKGVESMSDLIVITLLAAGMLGIVKAAGGIDYLLSLITTRGLGYRGAQAAIAVITSCVNLCTANNTVAILTTGSLSRSLATRYGISPRRAASLLDTSSCITQCLIPFGAQTLLVSGMAEISPAAPWPYLFYPWALCVCLAGAIIIGSPRHAVSTAEFAEA